MDKESLVHTYNGILSSHEKESLPSATWMGLEGITLGKVKSDIKKMNIIGYHYMNIHCINLKKSQTPESREQNDGY